MSGKFIVIEGVDFTGKTTQSKKISQMLTEMGIENIITREPGGTHLGESVRDLILSTAKVDPAKEAILLLFLAARAENISKVIRPALLQGKTVICDRFIASTIVYQGLLCGISVEDILVAHKAFNYDLLPDLTILLDAPVEVLLQRRDENASRHNNKYDFLPTETIKNLRQGFLDTADLKFLNTKVVNSNSTPEEAFESIKKIITDLFNVN